MKKIYNSKLRLKIKIVLFYILLFYNYFNYNEYFKFIYY